MKIRHPWLIALLGFVVAWVVRLWIRTLRYEYRALGDEDLAPTRPGLAERYIYAFWHENLLLPAYHHASPDVYVLISTHADGQLIATACRHLGFGLVRGSTTRGGVEAVRQMLRLGGEGHLAITPDGPRGPRRQVQMGTIYLAARTGMAVVVGGIAYRRPWRTNSWDRFALPRPWSRAICVTMPPIRVPGEASKEELEGYRRQVEDTLQWATAAAERWVETGEEPAPPVHAPRTADSGSGTA